MIGPSTRRFAERLAFCWKSYFDSGYYRTPLISPTWRFACHMDIYIGASENTYDLYPAEPNELLTSSCVCDVYVPLAPFQGSGWEVSARNRKGPSLLAMQVHRKHRSDHDVNYTDPADRCGGHTHIFLACIVESAFSVDVRCVSLEDCIETDHGAGSKLLDRSWWGPRRTPCLVTLAFFLTSCRDKEFTGNDANGKRSTIENHGKPLTGRNF